MACDIVEIVKSVQNGDERAMSEIVTMYKQLIFTIVYRLLKDYDMSLDVCQEVFIKAFQKIHKLNKPEKFKSWLCSIARNLCYDYLRKKKYVLQKSELPESDPAPEVYSGIRKRIIIQNAIAKLNPRDRLLLTLYYYQNFDIKEIAEIVKITPENVKVSLGRARIRLREELKGYEDELLS
ncbi:MAG: RNA polymerase sigma factor [bacterium]